jgi:signal transduction histidine kinase
MIYVITVNESRQWAETEINAVRRVAELLAHSIIEDSYRTQQIEQIEVLTRLDIQKANFVATVSHELRTPLTSIIGYLEVLKDGYAGELVDEQSRLIEVIDRNAGRLLGLINDLLTLTKSENDGLSDDVADMSISELITESCQELPPIVHKDAVTLEINAGPRAAMVRGDRSQLKSVIVNIVSNGIKFSRPGGVVKICCILDEVTHRIRIIVEDRGIGIPTDDQKELFTRFYRASNATAKFIPGTGLGLSIVKQIVNDHGGEIHLTSVEGEGTTVVVELPLASMEVGHSPSKTSTSSEDLGYSEIG